MKLHTLSLLAALALLGLAACSDDDGPTQPIICPTPTPAEAAYVINQGSYYSGIDGTLDRLDLATDAYTHSLFSAVNGRSLGDSPQDGVVHGSRLYVAMYGSNLVWVLDKETAAIVASIPTNEPEGICAAGGYVYVSNNDGYVTRIDTLTLQADAQLAVGPNPAHMLAANGYVYVSISDGYNSSAGYADGFRVAKLSADGGELTKVADIRVGMNPGPLTADADGNVFVVCRGDYGATAPMVQKITPDDVVSDFAPGSNVAAVGRNLYVVNNYTDWTVYPAETQLTFAKYVTTDGTLLTDDLLPQDASEAGDRRPLSPIDIDVDPTTGDIYIGSQPSAYDYTSAGYLYRYTQGGAFVARYDAGVCPCAVVFK